MKEKGLSADEVYDRNACYMEASMQHRTSNTRQSGNDMNMTMLQELAERNQ